MAVGEIDSCVDRPRLEIMCQSDVSVSVDVFAFVEVGKGGSVDDMMCSDVLTILCAVSL